jgi:1-pyrroline-5-carboxylate dehydrogenase
LRCFNGLLFFASRDFAGLHFTGSTHVFKDIWAKIGTNIHHYKTYPRIVGETGGKDFIIILCNLKQVSTGVRGAFEFQGQNVQQLQDLMYQKFMAD